MWRKHNSKCPPHLSLFRSTFQLDSVASLVNILLLNCELVCAFVLMNMEFVDVCDRTALLYRKDKEIEIFFKRLVSVNSVSRCLVLRMFYLQWGRHWQMTHVFPQKWVLQSFSYGHTSPRERTSVFVSGMTSTCSCNNVIQLDLGS